MAGKVRQETGPGGGISEARLPYLRSSRTGGCLAPERSRRGLTAGLRPGSGRARPSLEEVVQEEDRVREVVLLVVVRVGGIETCRRRATGEPPEEDEHAIRDVDRGIPVRVPAAVVRRTAAPGGPRDEVERVDVDLRRRVLMRELDIDLRESHGDRHHVAREDDAGV